MQRVTGIGGVFIKAADPKAMAAWYDKHLGLSFGENLYMTFTWVNVHHPIVPGATVFSFFEKGSKYFDPATGPFMINFRVKDLRILLDKLRQEDVEVVGDVQEEEYGKFAWILDPEGNKIELWEPADEKMA
jgi:catechol 2,3-dioxygenase-like lactoylglutathione lyase family enzyme